MEYKQKVLLQKVGQLMDYHAKGLLGGEVMPEDENPGLEIGSAENYTYFTLPMALNYQRNSYALWKAAHQSYLDADVRDIYSLQSVANMDIGHLRDKMTRHKVALQPNKQPLIWQTICVSIVSLFDGDIRRLFSHCNHSVRETIQFIALHKRAFPYLSGNKILNYWLFVMQKYTDLSFRDRDQITIAPDTHVIQSSIKLGLVTPDEAARSDVQTVVANRWKDILSVADIHPIDVHTPLWLWSRKGFAPDI